MPLEEDNLNRKEAVMTVDVDSWQTQLAFYGWRNEAYTNDVYERSLPRLVDLFAKFKIRATFFIVGIHAKFNANRITLRRLSEAGHELANHSMTHPQGFSGLSDRVKEAEISECTAVLEDIAGKRIKGFRAPDYDIDERTIDILIKHGYAYDASVFPTFLACAMKAAHFILSGTRIASTMGRAIIHFSPVLPYRPHINFIYKRGRADIVELPLTVTPFLRLPFYGTSIMALGEKYFDLAFAKVKNRPFINYTFHAFEMADKDNDDIDRRLFRHPGVKRPLNEKYRLCARVLDKISERYSIITAEEYVQRLKI